MGFEKGKQTRLHKDIPVTIVVECIRIQDLKLRNVPVAIDVLADKLLVWVCLLGVLVEELHIRVGRRRVEIVIELLDVLAVVPLVSGDAKQSLLKDTILAVP